MQMSITWNFSGNFLECTIQMLLNPIHEVHLEVEGKLLRSYGSSKNYYSLPSNPFMIKT